MVYFPKFRWIWVLAPEGLLHCHFFTLSILFLGRFSGDVVEVLTSSRKLVSSNDSSVFQSMLLIIEVSGSVLFFSRKVIGKLYSASRYTQKSWKSSGQKIVIELILRTAVKFFTGSRHWVIFGIPEWEGWFLLKWFILAAFCKIAWPIRCLKCNCYLKLVSSQQSMRCWRSLLKPP